MGESGMAASDDRLYEALLGNWSRIAAEFHASDVQIATCAARFAGLVIGQSVTTVERQHACLEACKHAMDSAFAGKILRDAGLAKSRKTGD